MVTGRDNEFRPNLLLGVDASGWDSQKSVSCNDSHSSTPISTAAGVPFKVIVTCSRVVDAASTRSLSQSFTLPILLDWNQSEGKTLAFPIVTNQLQLDVKAMPLNK